MTASMLWSMISKYTGIGLCSQIKGSNHNSVEYCLFVCLVFNEQSKGTTNISLLTPGTFDRSVELDLVLDISWSEYTKPTIPVFSFIHGPNHLLHNVRSVDMVRWLQNSLQINKLQF